MINFVQFLNVLPKAGLGMLGVFVVIGIIIGVVYLLNTLTNRDK